MTTPRSDADGPHLVALAVVDAIQRPHRAILFWVFTAALSLIGVSRLHVEIATESVLDQSGQEWSRYLRSTEVFGSDEDIVVAIPAREPFDDDALRVLSDLGDRLGTLRGVRRVDSLATTPTVIRSSNGDVTFSPPFSPSAPLEGKAARAEASLASEAMRGLLVSGDGRTFALRLRLDDPLALDVQRLSSEIAEVIGNREAWVSGVPIFRAETGLYTRREILRFIPITAVVMSALLFAFFRSFGAVCLPLLVGAIGALTVLGTMGALGVPLSLSAAILPSILLAIGCANVTHLLAEVSDRSRGHQLAAEVLEVGRPLTMAAVVTALAFLSGAFVPIEAVRVIAVFGALGALVVALATLHLAVAVLQVRSIRRSSHQTKSLLDSCARMLSRCVTSRPRFIVGLWATVLLIICTGVFKVSLETDVTQWFPKEGEVRRSYDEISKRLAGISPMNVVIDAGSSNVVTSAPVLQAIDGLASHLDSLPDVGRAIAVTTLLRDANRGLGVAHVSALPESVDLVEQYLLLLESSGEIREFVSSDRRLASVAIRANNNGSERLLAIAREAESWWRTHGVAGTSAHTTGIMFEFARAEREITTGQLSGLGIDCLALASLYLLLFRRLGLTVLAVIPTLSTVLATFGLLGWAGASLDAGTVFVGALAVGVTVDETVHLVSAYARERQRSRDGDVVVTSALNRVFPALLMTTATLAAGFLVLGVSSFEFTRQLGLATGAAMGFCALANATLLPSLLVLRERSSAARA